MKKSISILLLLILMINSYSQEFDSIVDNRDRKTYKIVKISNDWWFAENLAYIPFVCPSNDTCGIWVPEYQGIDYKGIKDSINYKKYGCLYNWHIAIKSCPSGWHLPSNNEWDKLLTDLGGDTIAGLKLKSTIDWGNDANYSSNETGFNAKPAGWMASCFFSGLGYNSLFWTSTSTNETEANVQDLFRNSNGVDRGDTIEKNEGYSVRCKKD